MLSVEDSMLQADQEHKAAKKGCCGGGVSTSNGRRDNSNPGLPAPKPSQRPLMYSAASGGDIEVRGWMEGCVDVWVNHIISNHSPPTLIQTHVLQFSYHLLRHTLISCLTLRLLLL